MSPCGICQFWSKDGFDLIDGHHLDCPRIPLPELTAEECAAAESFMPDLIDRLLRGERPLTDPTTFAN